MSAGEEYVVRWAFSGAFSHPFPTEEAAREYAEGAAATVHKLGPAIEPPEPREWVVYSDRDVVLSAGIITYDEAVSYAGQCEEHHNGVVKIARLVPENPA